MMKNPSRLICHNKECRFNDAKPCEAAEFCGGFMDTKTESNFVRGLVEKNKQMKAEVERLTAWANDLQSGMYVNCVYCGHRYGPGETTPVSMADALKEHIEHCPEHPMSKLKAESEQLQAELKKETELRMFFEKASRFIGQENFKAFAAGASRCCMCPGAICPGIPGTPHPEPSSCRLTGGEDDT